MNKRFPLGKLGRLDITAEPSAVGGFLLLGVVFGLLGVKLFRLKPGAATVGGLLAAALHFIAEMWHQLGHARAAEESGYPMEGVHLWGVLGTSMYPDDEPELPAEVHVARALGGPADLEEPGIVLQEQRDMVAGLQAERAEELRDAVGLPVELAIGDRLAAAGHDVGGLVGVRLGVNVGMHDRAA